MAIMQLNDAKRPYTAFLQTANFRDQDEGMFPFTYWLAYSYLYSDISASYINIDVPPGAIVLRVVHQISATLTGCTAIEVGDGTDPNGWIEDAWVAGATGTYLDYNAVYMMISKRYNTGDTIDIHFTGTPVSAGSGKLFIEMLSYTETLLGT